MYCIACGTPNSDQEKFCHRCGKPLVAAAGQAVGVAAPSVPAAPTAPYRNGNRLVVPKGAPLPGYCVKCGEPVTGEFFKKKFQWHSPWLYLLILIGILIYAIVAMILMKYAEVMVPLCPAHRQRRRNFMIAGWVMFLGSVPAGIFVGSLFPGDEGVGWGLLTGFLLFVGAIVAASVNTLMRPKEITADSATFGGVCEAFLTRLPAR